MRQRGTTRDVTTVPSGDGQLSEAARPVRAAAPRTKRSRARPRARRKILFVAANSRLGNQLALDEEYRAIEHSIRVARYRDAFEVIPRLAARRSDLEQALLEHTPDVVHFACHGGPQTEVQLLGDGAVPESMSVGAMTSLLGVLQDNLVLVVFNACYGAGQAAAIRQHAGIAIGMQERIEDDAAIAFARALYGALAYGRSVRDAFDLGVAALEAVEVSSSNVPQLFVGPGIDAHAVRLVGPGGVPGRSWMLGGVALAAIVLLFVAWRFAVESTRSSEPVASSGPALTPRSPGMVRFAATSVHTGALPAPGTPDACQASQDAEDCADPAHAGNIADVPLQSFDLDVLEVTAGDYARWLMKNSTMWTVTPKGVVKMRDEPGVALVLVSEKCGGGLTTAEGRVAARLDRAAWPVTCVTWHGANEYCRAQHKRLPLEAEWEFAAVGHGDRLFPWGAEPPRHDGVAFDLRDGASAHPRDVGTSLQDVSPEGIRDLGGNAAEWVEDGRTGLTRTIRGGSWASRGPCRVLGSSCRQITVGAVGPYGPDVGFRCASSVVE